MKKLVSLAVVATLILSSCGKIYDRIDNLDARLDQLEGSIIPSINEQIENINTSIADLKSVDTELHKLIDTLELESESHDNLIEALYNKDSELEEKIATLEKYVNDKISTTKDWATATFATLEQYAEVQSEISTLKALIEQNKSDITEAYTTAIAEAIATSESSMKEWVSEQLAGYYTIAETDAKLELLQSSIDTLSESLAEEVETLSGRIDTMKSELTETYEAAITEAIETNNGVINSKIAEEINSVNSRIDEEVASINARIDALEGRIKDLEDALDKIKALDIVFDIESGEACMAGSSIEFGYTIVGGDEDTEVESFGDGGWRADVTPTDATSGRIRVTAPKDGGNGKVIVLATSGAGASAMKSIRFDEGVIADILDSYEVDWEACTLEVKLRTNLDYTVNIPAESQSWISVADTRTELHAETLTFSISENPEDEPERNATIEIVNEIGDVLQSFEIVQASQPSSDPIQFADQYVKKVCVEKFDANGDGELSYKEAALVTDLSSNFFGDYAIAVKSFDELQYFVNLKSIGDYVFYKCSNLKIISIPDSVTNIGYDAFGECYNITEVYIFDIGLWCNINFAYIINIGLDGESIRLSESNPLFSGANLYLNGVLVTELHIPNTTDKVKIGAFTNCKSICKVIIPESVTIIGEYAFGGCSSLTSITIPDSVVLIGDSAFKDCNSLTSVTIPDSIVSIENSSFYGCSSLTSVTIPDSVVSIGDYAFYDCRSLTSVTIPDSVVSIENSSFYGCSSLTSVTIPDSVVSIENSSFYGCSSLTSVTIPDSVVSIGDSAFNRCSSLTSVTIPNSVVSIGGSAFNRCSSLTSVTIPDSVVSIGDYAFYDCSSLTSITIPDGVTSIGYSAFRGCSSMKEVYCKSTTPPAGGSEMFYNNSLERKIYVPTESVETYKSAEYWKNYADDIVGYDYQ